MTSKRIKTLSFSSSQSSNSLIDEDLLVSKPNYNEIQDKNMKTINKLINSPVQLEDLFNLSFYDQNVHFVFHFQVYQ